MLRLAGFDLRLGTCITVQIIGPGRKLNAYVSIARLLGVADSTIKKLLSFQQRTFYLAEKRNRVVHDQWMIFPGGQTFRFEITANKKLIAEYIDHPTETVEALIVQIRQFTARFERLDEAIIRSLPASPDKS